MNKHRIIFFGTPEFAVPALETLINDDRFLVMAVVTEPDRKAGRGKKIVFSPIKKFVEEYNNARDSSTTLRSARNDKKIKIFQPEKIQAISYKLQATSCDVAVVAAYGQIIPQEILEIPKYGFINIHPSLLPKYRGSSPIQAAILNGDKETGVTIMKIDEKMDHGPILAQQELEFPISLPRGKAGNFQFPNKFQISNYQTLKLNYLELSQILSGFGSKLLIKILPDYLKGKIKPKPQDHKKATYTKLIKKEDGLISWDESIEIIERKIRAYYPWPGTYTLLNGKRLKFLKAHLSSSTPWVEDGDNKLVLDQVQLEGKKPVSWEEFKKGYRQKIYPEYFRGVDISDKIMV